MAAIARRIARRKARALLVPPANVERRYVSLLSSGFREIHRHVLAFLKPHLGTIAHGKPKRTDAAPSVSHDLAELVDLLAKQLQKKILPDFDAMARRIAENNGRALAELGINLVREQPGLMGLIAQARTENLNLIRNASTTYLDGIRAVLDAPDAWGLTVGELEARLVERGGVAESRAELIARDQVLKINGDLNQMRQRAAGVDSYTWSGSLDERERDTHLKNEGHTFSWLQPPAETGHPSEDINCRCVAIPVVPELDAEAAGEESPPDATSAVEPPTGADLPIAVSPGDFAPPKDQRRVEAGRKGAQRLLERNSEIHDYVKSNLPPELHPLWEKQGRAFMKGLGSHAGLDRFEVKSLKKAGATRYRQAVAERASSAFLEHVGQSEEERDFSREVFGLSETKGEKAIAEHERELAEKYQADAIARGDMNERGELTEQGRERIAREQAEQEARDAEAAAGESQQEAGGFFDDLLEGAADDLDDAPF